MWLEVRRRAAVVSATCTMTSYCLPSRLNRVTCGRRAGSRCRGRYRRSMPRSAALSRSTVTLSSGLLSLRSVSKLAGPGYLRASARNLVDQSCSGRRRSRGLDRRIASACRSAHWPSDGGLTGKARMPGDAEHASADARRRRPRRTVAVLPRLQQGEADALVHHRKADDHEVLVVLPGTEAIDVLDLPGVAVGEVERRPFRRDVRWRPCSRGPRRGDSSDCRPLNRNQPPPATSSRPPARPGRARRACAEQAGGSPRSCRCSPSSIGVVDSRHGARCCAESASTSWATASARRSPTPAPRRPASARIR